MKYIYYYFELTLSLRKFMKKTIYTKEEVDARRVNLFSLRILNSASIRFSGALSPLSFINFRRLVTSDFDNGMILAFCPLLRSPIVTVSSSCTSVISTRDILSGV